MYSMLADEWPAAKAKLEERLRSYAAPSQPSPRGKGGADVRLEPITSDNLLAVLRLNPGAIGERMVATNAVSIAQASVSANAVPCAIVAGAGDAAKPVGFIMLYDPRLIRARGPRRGTRRQHRHLAADGGLSAAGRGYGAAAIISATRYAATRSGITQLRLSYVPREGNPSPFYPKRWGSPRPVRRTASRSS